MKSEQIKCDGCGMLMWSGPLPQTTGVSLAIDAVMSMPQRRGRETHKRIDLCSGACAEKVIAAAAGEIRSIVEEELAG